MACWQSPLTYIFGIICSLSMHLLCTPFILSRLNMNWHQIILAVLSAHTLFADTGSILQGVAAEPRLKRRGRGRFRPKPQEKYFHEPGGSELGNHYDVRYFNGVQKYEDKQDTQLHMLRAYLLFFQEKDVETWLAHGTLLGWWWNGKVHWTLQTWDMALL